ncbi:MAG: SDR family oxidoreductase [Cyanobacteria bacterium P01_G01_bin.19]
MLLNKKVALIIGIKDDIGSVTAEIMAREGAKVVIAERNLSDGQALAEKIVAGGGEAVYAEMNVTLSNHHQATIARIVRDYGRLDVAFNNVSVDGDFFPLAQQSENMVVGVIDVNLNGMWLSMKYQIEQMLKNGGGSIVNNVSHFDSNGSPGCSLFCATKSAVTTMSKVAASEYASNNIRINTISPGAYRNNIKTPSTNSCFDVRKMAEAIVWLCSDKASTVTGQELLLNSNMPIPGNRSLA